MKYVLTDIEGTTTPIAFVHKVLFPYSASRLPGFIRTHAHDAVVRAALNDVKATARDERQATLDDEGAIAELQTYIAQDRKHGALKTLQGLVWRDGYEQGAYAGQVYDDVPPHLALWRKRGMNLGIYSSGSVEAQKLLFRHTGHGDLTPLFRDHFDTAVGGKKNTSSYEAIVRALSCAAEDIAFLSDVTEELDAAAAAGMRTVHLVRPGTAAPAPGTARHPVAADFAGVEALFLSGFRG